MTYISCAPADIYRNGAWYDDPVLLNELFNGAAASVSPEPCAEIFPPYRYERPPAPSFGGSDAKRGYVAAVARDTDRTFPCGPGSVLVRLSSACVSRTVVYSLDGDATRVLYETHRPADREVSPVRDPAELRLVEDYRRADPFVAHVWIGSAGTHNYGHWLVDDLPRLQALTELRRLRPYAKLQILMPNVGPTHNQVHAESCGAICRSLGIENVELVFVDREAKIYFDELYYVSPVTHHPVLKSPDAMRFVARNGLALESDDAHRPETPRRLFVTRRWSGKRDLANQDDLAALLSSRGFVAVDPGRMPYLSQARLFGGADYVVGCMGASMTNTLFCPEHARIGYLAPEGWFETFYWDLAAVRGHRYAVCFGHTSPEDGPAHDKNYRVNPRDLEAMLDALETGPKALDPFRF